MLAGNEFKWTTSASWESDNLISALAIFSKINDDQNEKIRHVSARKWLKLKKFSLSINMVHNKTLKFLQKSLK